MHDDPSVRVLLVEDSPALSLRLQEMLQQLPDVALVGAVDNEAAAIRAVGSGNVDALILDLQLRHGSGFGVLRGLHGLPHPPAAIVLTNYALPAYEREALVLGAYCFLDKAREFSRLPDLLHEIAAARRAAATH